MSPQAMAKFNAPVIQDNPSGWGPCAVPEKFKDMPYQPFSKGDRLGKVCLLRVAGPPGRNFVAISALLVSQVADWTGATYQDKRYTSRTTFNTGFIVIKLFLMKEEKLF